MRSIKAKPNKIPFVLVAALAVVPCFLAISSFVDGASFSFHSLFLMLLICGISVAFCLPLIVILKISQSIVLTDAGVESLRWRWPTVSRLFPVLEKNFLGWGEVRRWVMKNDGMIYLYFDKEKISINTFYFKERDDVVRLINSATSTSRKGSE